MNIINSRNCKQSDNRNWSFNRVERWKQSDNRNRGYYVGWSVPTGNTTYEFRSTSLNNQISSVNTCVYVEWPTSIINTTMQYMQSTNEQVNEQSTLTSIVNNHNAIPHCMLQFCCVILSVWSAFSFQLIIVVLVVSFECQNPGESYLTRWWLTRSDHDYWCLYQLFGVS